MMQTGICSEDTSAPIDFSGVEQEPVLDVAEEVEPEKELSFSEKLYCLEEAVTRHPLNREVLYAILDYCESERSLSDIEEFVSTIPQFKMATQNQYRMVQVLEKAYGLEVIEYDAEGGVVDSQTKATLNEDEVDDLIAMTSYRATEVGSVFVEQHNPKARIVELFNLTPERADAYKDVLSFINEGSRSYKDISNFLQGSPALETEIDGRLVTMQPSVLVDKLERAGALVWNEKWELSTEGGEFLNELKER